MSALYLPCGHREQGADPLTSLYLPLAHGSHAPPSGPVYPIRQVQLVIAGLPAIDKVSAGHCAQVYASISAVPVEYLPASQSEQATEPFTSLYLPATQGVQGPPSGPVCPRLQVQFVTVLLPAPE